MTGPPIDLAVVAQQFQRFATVECPGSTPLYERLSAAVAADPELLALAAHAQPNQPIPNLLFGAAHLLLLRETQHPIAAFYPDISELPAPEGDPYPLFRAFCMDRREEIVRLVGEKRVQTNEVRRSACLMPAFQTVARRAGHRALSLVEIGTSAGLNLLWDRYQYDYGEGGRYGDPTSAVTLRCRLKGQGLPALSAALPQVAYRIGIDLRPVDIQDPEAVGWLRALIWPEHRERVQLLENALQIARKEAPILVEGDALDRLPGVLAILAGEEPDEHQYLRSPAEASGARLPPALRSTTLCLFHSFTLYQFSPDARRSLEALIEAEAMRRDVYVVSVEGRGQGHAAVELEAYEQGGRIHARLATCHPHGVWLDWENIVP